MKRRTPKIAPAGASRRWLLATLAACGAAALLLAGGMAWLLRSDGGSPWLLARVPGLSASGTVGLMTGGPFSAERLELKLGQRTLTVHGLTWQDAHWTWRPPGGAWAGVVLVAPHAARIEIGGAASGEPLTAPASLRLPIVLTLQSARIDALHIDGQAPLTQLSGNAELGARGGSEHRIEELAFNWDKAHLEGRGSVASDTPFALDAQLDARSRDGVAAAWQARASARGPLAALSLQAQLGSDKAPGATLRAEASLQPFAAWPLAALVASAQDLDLAALGSGLPRTRLAGRADIDSRSLDVPISARIALTNAEPGRWDQQRLPVGAIELELSGQPRDRSRLALQRLDVQLPAGAGRIDGSGEWHASAARFTLRLHGVRPALLDARAAAMTLAGSASVQLSGLPSPDGKLAAAASQGLQARLALDGRLDARSALPVQLRAQAEAERNGPAWRFALRDVDARSGPARAQATLTAERSAQGLWQLRSRGELAAIDPALWFPGGGNSAAASAWRQGPHRLAGRWQAELQTGAAPAAPSTLPAQLLAWRGEAELELRDSLLAGVPMQGRVKLNGRTAGWAVDADLSAGSNRALLQGQLAPRAEADRWRIEIDAPALAGLQPLTRLHEAAAAALRAPDGSSPLSGQLAGQWQVQGRWPDIGVGGSLRATALQTGPLRAARLNAQVQAGPDANAPLALQLEAEQLSFGAQRIDSLQARVDGSLANHRLMLEAQSPLRPPAWADPLIGSAASGSRWQVQTQAQWLVTHARNGLLPGRWQTQGLALQAQGRSDPVSVSASASVSASGSAAATAPIASHASAAWLRARDVRLQLQLDANARLQAISAEPGRIEVLGAALRWSEAAWRAASGSTPAEASLAAQLEPLALAPWLTRLQPGSGLGGNLMLAGNARVKLGPRFSADLVLERASGDLTMTDEIGTQAFGLTDLRLAVAAADGTWHFTQAVAGSNVGVLAGAQSLRLSPQATWPLPSTPMQGVLEWQVADLGAWAPFTPPGWRLGGTLRTGAALGGSFGAPEIVGEMSGSRLALRNLLQGVDVRDGELALSLRGSQATIERFVFKAGSGELRLTGGASLGANPSARLQLMADRFQVLGRFDRRIVASGSATLLLAPQALSLDGRVRVDEGLIDFSRSDAPTLDTDVQVRGGRSAAAAAEQRQASAGANGNARNRPEVRLALQVELGDELKVRGRGLDTRLRGSLALATPGGRLTVAGSVRTEAGTYAAYGQKLSIERGVLSFNGAAENPRLEILAVRPNLDLRVGVQVSGSAQVPRVRLFSEPEMSDTDKLSWLVLGRAPDGLARTDTALLQRAALALLAGEGEGLESHLLANLGLDEFSVRQTESGEVRETVVSLGKQLSRRWYVGYERGVNTTTGTWQLIYRVAQRFTVRAQAGEDNALDAIWTWRWN